MAWPGSIVSLFIEGARGSRKVQPAGVDLSVAEIYKASEQGVLGREERIVPRYVELKPGMDSWTLRPGYYIVRFAEAVEIPVNAVGLCFPRSTLLRMGATLHCAVWDPGYRGRGYALLAVYNENGVKIERNARIAQMVYLSLAALPSHTYEGRYQGEGLGDNS